MSAGQPTEEEQERTIYVGNLTTDATKEILYTIFIPFGDIKHIDMPQDLETGATRGMAFVEYFASH